MSFNQFWTKRYGKVFGMQHLDSIKMCCFIIIFLSHNNFESLLFSSESSQIIPIYFLKYHLYVLYSCFVIKSFLQRFDFFNLYSHLYKKSMRRAIMAQLRLLSIKFSDVVEFIRFSQNIPVFRCVRVL